MSILDTQVKDEEEICFNFINSIRSETTKRVYERDLRFYLNYCNLHKMSELLELKDPQKQIINYVMSLRKRGLASNSISTMLMGIYHFYEMNDVPLNKKKINMFKGEFSRKVIDRAYENHEIRKLLDFSDFRMKVVILLMASSGKNMKKPDSFICEVIETRMNEIIDKINKTDSLFESDPLDSELRILDWIFYQACKDQ